MEALINRQQQFSDTDIVYRVIAGEKEMYELVVRKYNQRLFRMGMALLNNDSEVEDMMQIAYIKAYENLARFEHRSSFATWLTRIFLNECYQHLNKVQTKNRFTGSYAALAEQTSIEMKTPDRLMQNKELGKALENALARLPEKYRLVFAMREMEDMSIAETAGALDISESNVKVRLNRAKTMLREALAGYYRNDRVYSFHLTRCDRIAHFVMEHIRVAS